MYDVYTWCWVASTRESLIGLELWTPCTWLVLLFMRASEQLSFLQSEREYRITHTLLFHVILCGVALVHYLYNKRRYVCLSVSMFRVAGQTAGPIETNLTHALMSTQVVFLSRSMSRSFMYACGSDRITKHPECCAKATPGERCSNYVRRTREATPGEHLRNSVRTTGNYSSSNEATSRTPSGGWVIIASYL